MDLITLEAQKRTGRHRAGQWDANASAYSVGALEIIAGPPNPDSWRAHPHRGGIPILFPWPGPNRGCAASISKAAKYLLPINEAREADMLFTASRASVPFELRGKDHTMSPPFLIRRKHPDISKGFWPWPFILEINYEVGNGLRVCAPGFSNSGNSTMPFGFRRPSIISTRRSIRARVAPAISVQLDANSRWPLRCEHDSVRPAGAARRQSTIFASRVRWMRRPSTTQFRMTVATDASAPRAARMIDSVAEPRSLKCAPIPAFGDFVVLRAREQFSRRAGALHLRRPTPSNLAMRGPSIPVLANSRPGLVFEAGFRNPAQRPLELGIAAAAPTPARPPRGNPRCLSASFARSTSSSWKVIFVEPITFVDDPFRESDRGAARLRAHLAREFLGRPPDEFLPRPTRFTSPIRSASVASIIRASHDQFFRASVANSPCQPPWCRRRSGTNPTRTSGHPQPRARRRDTAPSHAKRPARARVLRQIHARRANKPASRYSLSDFSEALAIPPRSAGKSAACPGPPPLTHSGRQCRWSAK